MEVRQYNFFFFYFMSFKKPDHYIDCKALSELKQWVQSMRLMISGGLIQWKINGLYIALALQKERL